MPNHNHNRDTAESHTQTHTRNATLDLVLDDPPAPRGRANGSCDANEADEQKRRKGTPPVHATRSLLEIARDLGFPINVLYANQVNQNPLTPRDALPGSIY